MTIRMGDIISGLNRLDEVLLRGRSLRAALEVLAAEYGWEKHEFGYGPADPDNLIHVYQLGESHPGIYQQIYRQRTRVITLGWSNDSLAQLARRPRASVIDVDSDSMSSPELVMFAAMLFTIRDDRDLPDWDLHARQHA